MYALDLVKEAFDPLRDGFLSRLTTRILGEKEHKDDKNSKSCKAFITVLCLKSRRQYLKKHV